VETCIVRSLDWLSHSGVMRGSAPDACSLWYSRELAAGTKIAGGRHTYFYVLKEDDWNESTPGVRVSKVSTCKRKS